MRLSTFQANLKAILLEFFVSEESLTALRVRAVSNQTVLPIKSGFNVLLRAITLLLNSGSPVDASAKID